LLVFTAFVPREIIQPSLLPWHPAAEENFFRNRFYAWVFTMLKCIPVRPGRRDLKAINRSTRALEEGTMILFPEGTRSRDGSIGRVRPGAGLVLLGTGATVIPVTITGMDRVLPIGALIPRVGNRVSVYFGRPIDYSDLADQPRSRETAQRVVDRVMDRVRFQRRVIERLERR
jgi:1-acyl-sn-glycerol-3-phosphate acyltransferase